MSSVPCENYLVTEVMTSTPQKLQLMLIEGAIRAIERGRQKRRAGDDEQACESLLRAQEIVGQLLDGTPGAAVTNPAVIGGVGTNLALRVLNGEEVEQTELETFCAERLADFKRPRRWRFVDELPRNTMGKILKRELRDQLAAEVAS